MKSIKTVVAAKNKNGTKYKAAKKGNKLSISISTPNGIQKKKVFKITRKTTKPKISTVRKLALNRAASMAAKKMHTTYLNNHLRRLAEISTKLFKKQAKRKPNKRDTVTILNMMYIINKGEMATLVANLRRRKSKVCSTKINILLKVYNHADLILRG